MGKELLLIAITLILMGTASAFNISDGIYSYSSFGDEQVSDTVIEKGRLGSSGCLSVLAGKIGSGMDCGGSGTYLEGSFTTTTGPQTASFWVRPDAIDRRTLFDSGGSNGGAPGLFISMTTTGDLLVAQQSDGCAWSTEVHAGMSRDQWSHIVVTATGDTQDAG